ncbi:hypothetical protein ACFQQB_54050 [Nonomuraea rubra]|uniref:hypothetical protein n=1 Tax=Nonomuraea rubra TaxID=46180 RepID=UPI0036179D64
MLDRVRKGLLEDAVRLAGDDGGHAGQVAHLLPHRRPGGGDQGIEVGQRRLRGEGSPAGPADAIRAIRAIRAIGTVGAVGEDAPGASG